MRPSVGLAPLMNPPCFETLEKNLCALGSVNGSSASSPSWSQSTQTPHTPLPLSRPPLHGAPPGRAALHPSAPPAPPLPASSSVSACAFWAALSRLLRLEISLMYQRFCAIHTK